MGIYDGQAVNAANTNPAFLDANADDVALGRIDFANGLPESGDSIVNIQRELNAISSFLGKLINQAKDNLPTWTNNDAGTSIDNFKARLEALTIKFNPTTGHKHTGAAGDAPSILGVQISAVPLAGYIIQGSNLTTVTGTSKDVSSSLSGRTNSSGTTSLGVVVTAPNNKILLRNSSDDQFTDAFGNVVYGRLTYSASVYTLSFYVDISGTETAYTFSSSTVKWYFQQLYNPMDNPPVYSEFSVVPSDNSTADVITATTALQGKASLSSTTPAAIASTGAAGTANASVANADHTHAGLHSISKSGSSALVGDVTLTGSTNIALTQASQDISAAITGQIPIGNGGTGQSTAAAAILALLPSQTSNSGKVYTTDGTVASWTSPTSTIAAKDEGTTLTAAATGFNFVGAGVTATNSGGLITVTIPGGGGGGSTLTPLSKTANYTVLSTDNYIRASASSGAFTLTLPAASGGGQSIYITKTDSSGNAVTITAAGGDSISGSASQTLDAQFSSLTLISSGGSSWDVF